MKLAISHFKYEYSSTFGKALIHLLNYSLLKANKNFGKKCQNKALKRNF